MRILQIRCRDVARPLVAGLLASTLGGCNRPAPDTVAAPLPLVYFDFPRTDEVTDFEEFTGRAEALQSVELRSRVTGYLDALHFTDGEVVPKGKLLFTIDDRLYKAELDRATASLKVADAHLARVNRDYVRVEKLKDSRAVSAEEFDKVVGDQAESEAALNVATAAVVTAKQNLAYTKIAAPVAGRMSRRYADPGNLVKADDTPLSMLLNIDKIHVYFDVDDRTSLEISRAVAQGTLKFEADSKTEVEIGLPDEEGYYIRGKIDFIDNKFDQGTGTRRLRAVVENSAKVPTPAENSAKPPAENATTLLSPGLFVRVKLPTSGKRQVLLVPEVSLGTNQGKKFVYALTDKDEVVRRDVAKVGKQYGPYRVLLESKVLPTERILVKGIQRVRDGVKVEARRVEAAPAKDLSPDSNQTGKSGVPSKPTGSAAAPPAPQAPARSGS